MAERMIRVLICGDRNWTDKELIRAELVKLLNEQPIDEVCVIEGEARGADSLARDVAYELGVYRVMKFPADWEKHHRAAGPIRNRQMLVEGKPDVVWAFHDDLENSKGTANMVHQATKAGIPVTVFKHPVQVLPTRQTGQLSLDDLEEVEI